MKNKIKIILKIVLIISLCEVPIFIISLTGIGYHSLIITCCIVCVNIICAYAGYHLCDFGIIKKWIDGTL